MNRTAIMAKKIRLNFMIAINVNLYYLWCSGARLFFFKSRKPRPHALSIFLKIEESKFSAWEFPNIAMLLRSSNFSAHFPWTPIYHYISSKSKAERKVDILQSQVCRGGGSFKVYQVLPDQTIGGTGVDEPACYVYTVCNGHWSFDHVDENDSILVPLKATKI